MANQIIELCRKNPPLERHDDGTPYVMNPDQMKRAKKLISSQCCNYDNGNCLVLDNGETCGCPQMIACTVCCRWFRFAVLPADWELETDIYADRGKKKRCCECGALFVPKSNRGKYCPICAERMRLAHAAERQKRWREKGSG